MPSFTHPSSLVYYYPCPYPAEALAEAQLAHLEEARLAQQQLQALQGQLQAVQEGCAAELAAKASLQGTLGRCVSVRRGPGMCVHGGPGIVVCLSLLEYR